MLASQDKLHGRKAAQTVSNKPPTLPTLLSPASPSTEPVSSRLVRNHRYSLEYTLRCDTELLCSEIGLSQSSNTNCVCSRSREHLRHIWVSYLGYFCDYYESREETGSVDAPERIYVIAGCVFWAISVISLS